MTETSCRPRSIWVGALSEAPTALSAINVGTKLAGAATSVTYTTSPKSTPSALAYASAKLFAIETAYSRGSPEAASVSSKAGATEVTCNALPPAATTASTTSPAFAPSRSVTTNTCCPL